jgi:hypothetical protein
MDIYKLINPNPPHRNRNPAPGKEKKEYAPRVFECAPPLTSLSALHFLQSHVITKNNHQ